MRKLNGSTDFIESKKKSQTAELIRAGDYKNGDYVLWLICDMYYRFAGEKRGRVHIFTEDGEILTPQVIRNPYPNKCISQISLTNGKKRIFGIPLIFKNMADLKKIRNIVVIWDVYNLAYDKQGRKYTEWMRNVETYNISFKDTIPEQKIYVLMSKTYQPIDTSEICQKYLEEFQSFQMASDTPLEGSAYFLAPEHTHKTKTFKEACDMLIIPNTKGKLKMEMDVGAASLAYGMGWKEKDVHKTILVLTAEATLESKAVAPFFYM